MKKADGGALIRRQSFGRRLSKDFQRNKYVYLMLIPVLAFYILFKFRSRPQMTTIEIKCGI